MIKKIFISILFILFTIVSYTQVLRPSAVPSPSSTGFSKIGYSWADSGFIWGARDTFPAKYKTTIWHNDGNFYKTPGGAGSYWSLWIPSTPGTINNITGTYPILVTGSNPTRNVAADTGRNTTQIVTGGDLNKVRDSLVGLISGGGFGTVMSVSVVDANGITSTVVNPTSNPAITLNLTNITPTSVNSSGAITATVFNGAGTGLTGNAASLNSGSSTLVNVTDENESVATVYPTWVTSTSGNRAINVSSTKLSFVPNTGTLTAVSFSGSGAALSGVVTSIATNNGTGITGGTITNTGTLANDTTLLATRAWVTGQNFGSQIFTQTGFNITPLISGSTLSTTGGGGIWLFDNDRFFCFRIKHINR